MAENWKGPTAIIGILTVLTTIGIFVYQELKTPHNPSNQDSLLFPQIDTPKLTLKDYEEKVGRWETKLDSINRSISLYNDSFKLKAKWISKTESWILLKKDILN